MHSFLKLSAVLLISLSIGMCPTAHAGGIALRFGPPGSGGGGPNPVSIPPDGGDIGLSYVTDKGLEFNASVIALSVAKRTQVKAGTYLSLGGGLAISSSGAGFGPYAGFGYEGACTWIGCYAVEYQQALGLGYGTLVSPSALRMGLIRWF